MDDPEIQFRRAAYNAECLTLIAQYGWMVQGVFPSHDTPPEKRYEFCYTVGLADKGLPEFIEYGLNLESGKVTLNDLAKRAAGGELFAPGVLIEFQNDYHGMLIEADDLSDLTLARYFYGEDIRAFQLVFEDLEHRWPNDPGYGFKDLPILGRFPTTHH
jgi:hypothetical protein